MNESEVIPTGPVIEAPVNGSASAPEPSEQPLSHEPAPVPAKPKKLIKPGGKIGRKIAHRSTKLELERERLTAAIITCLVAGKTINEISAELGVSDTVVIRVRADLPEGFIEYFTKAKTNEISELIESGLKAQLKALQKIVEVTNDEVWLKGQRAPELATLFGVVSDKTVRVLAAIDRANEREREQSLPPARTVNEPVRPVSPVNKQVEARAAA